MTTLHIVVTEPKSDEAAECACCGFDAVLKFPLHQLTNDGVWQFGHWAGCVRCWDTGCSCSPLRERH